MKVCILNDSWAPVWGGGPEHIWQLSNKLVKNYDCQVDIVVPNLVNRSGKLRPLVEVFQRGRLKVIRVGPRFVFPNLLGRLGFMVAYFRYCVTHRDYDIYHSQYYSTSVFLLPIKLLTGRKIVFTLHGAGVKGMGAGIFNLFGSLLSNMFLYKIPYDRLETVARNTIEPGYRSKFIVIGNGVNLEDFKSVKAKRNKEIFRVLWVGREYDPVKGLNVLKKAFARVAKQFRQARLVIVSGRPREEVLAEYIRSDLFVLSSLSEGLPLTILEAMAAKLPVVASRVGDIPGIVLDQKTGYLVNPGDIPDLTAKIIAAINNPRLKEMGEAGYNLIEAKYTWDKVAHKQYAIYKKVLQG